MTDIRTAEMIDDDHRPYTVHSPSKITLRPEAKFWAREHGLSNIELAKHLLAQERLRELGHTQRDGES
jgi:hypothetical protein